VLGAIPVAGVYFKGIYPKLLLYPDGANTPDFMRVF
jgi:hypothetical protein